MSSLALAVALAALVIGGPKPVEEKKETVPHPECASGTMPKTWEQGTEITKYRTRPNGIKEGPFVVIYTETGKMLSKGNYHNDSKHGSWSAWYYDGTLKEQGNYQEGYQRGFWTSFHANGKKATSGEHGVDGKRGEWSSWDAEGKLLETSEYRNGVLHGFSTTYDPKSGKILSSVEYANGVERPKR